jgi:hypothetical protein
MHPGRRRQAAAARRILIYWELMMIGPAAAAVMAMLLRSHVPPPTSHDHDRTGRGRPDPQQSTPALHHLHGIAAASYGVLVHVPLLASSKARILASHHIYEMDRSTT